MDEQRIDREGNGSVRGRQFALVWLLIAALVSSAVLLGALRFSGSSGSIDETVRRGNIIIQALNKYHEDRGQFPATLTDLRPEYLKEIPTPDWGLRAWKYGREAGTSFYLGVDETKYTGDGDSRWLRYDGPKWGWQEGD
jgi:hypothetical protein